MNRTDSEKWAQDTRELAAQRERYTEGYGWADYEIRAISGEGGSIDQATYALGFSEENFNMQNAQAVSCDVCGGLFKERLVVMRRHRLACGWE